MREGRNVATEGGVVYLIDQDPEEGGVLIVRIGLELRIDLDNECRGYGGEQTSLRHASAHVCLKTHATYEYQRCVQILAVFFQKFLVVQLALPMVTFVEFGTGVLL